MTTTNKTEADVIAWLDENGYLHAGRNHARNGSRVVTFARARLERLVRAGVIGVLRGPASKRDDRFVHADHPRLSGSDA